MASSNMQGVYHPEQILLHHVFALVIIVQSQTTCDYRQVDRVGHSSPTRPDPRSGPSDRHGHPKISGVDGVAHLVQQCLEQGLQLGEVQVAVPLCGPLVQVEGRPAGCGQRVL